MTRGTRPEVDRLALFSGTPSFPEPLHVGRPNIGDPEYLLRRINEAVDRRWLTNRGPLVQEFERKVQDYLGVRHCVAMSNGTVALEIAIRAAEISGEVIVPSFTFIATAHALQWQEITPVFCDVDPKTHNIDPRRVEELITPRTTAIIGVHVWGRPCDVEALTGIAERNGLVLMFDAAHALGSSHRGRMVGGFGLAEVFSFHATKFVNCLEGGAVTTNDDLLAAKIRLKKNFGFTDVDTVSHVGTNGKMNEFSAAMGLTNLRNVDTFIAHNRKIHDAYREGLAGLPGLDLVLFDPSERNNYQYAVALVDEAKCGLSRDDLVVLLGAENVRARRYFYPGCHRMEPYRSSFPENGVLLPETEVLAERILALPTGEVLSVRDAAVICGLIRTGVENADAVKKAVRALPPSQRPRLI